MNKFILLGLAGFFITCNTNDKISAADNYMDHVKTETYTDTFLPDLEPSDIPALLSYRNDNQILAHPITNPISSYHSNHVTAGMIALWTIESIRVSEIHGDTNKYLRFPSLNPMVSDTINGMDENGRSQDSIAKYYYNWWNNNSIGLVDKLLQNPLSSTMYRWY